MVASERERSSSEADATHRSAVCWIVWWAVACLVGGCGDAAEPRDGRLETATVERVVDGDTVDVRIGGTSERVRLIGVDAPESVARNVPVQCFGAEASAALAELLPPGTTVNVERDVEARDHYDRLLLYLYRPDGLFVNQWLLESGLGEAVSYEPNVTHEPALTRARHRAARELVGLWAVCDGPDQPLR